MKRFLPFLAIGVVLLLAGGLIYQMGTPRLVSVEPTSASTNVAANAPLRMTFSRAMRAASVIEHLEIIPRVEGDFQWEGRTLVFRPVRSWSGGEKYLVQLSAGSRASGLLSLPILKDYRVDFTVTRPRLVYLYPADGLADLYAIRPETSEIERLTTTPLGILDFDVNPLLNALVFSSPNELGGSDLYLLDLNVDATEEKNHAPVSLLLKCGKTDCRMPKISSAGNILAYELTISIEDGGIGYPQVWVAAIDPDTKLPGEASLVGNPAHQTLQPNWSTDGVLSFYDSSAKTYSFVKPQANTGSPVEIAQFANETGEMGCWSPDGAVFVATEITFVRSDNQGYQIDPDLINNSHLMRFQLATNEVLDLSKAENVDDASPAFSPDGLAIGFARRYINITRWTPGRQLWIMSITADGSVGEEFPLTNDPNFNHYDLTWNPGGNRLAYVRFNQTTLTDLPEIWLIDPANGETQPLVTGGYSPAWIP
jgi:Tol biopolymer transport system component